MNVLDYQNQVKLTQREHDDLFDRLNHLALGLAGEAGEVANAVKKVVYHGHPLDSDKLVEELGDTLWYLTALADALHLDLAIVMDLNVTKLQKRYPEGFDPYRSLNRAS